MGIDPVALFLPARDNRISINDNVPSADDFHHVRVFAGVYIYRD